MTVNIKLLILDFDGVLTDNTVFVDSSGNEAVKCNRSDGLAIKAIKRKGIHVVICSTEKNDVVISRGNKLDIDTYNGINNKLLWLVNYLHKNNVSKEDVCFIGNDINDYDCINYCGFSACPSDSNDTIIKVVDYVLKCKGGEGVIREFVEKILKIDIYSTLFT